MNKLIKAQNDLHSQYPSISSDRHYLKNDNITPKNVLTHSEKKYDGFFLYAMNHSKKQFGVEQEVHTALKSYKQWRPTWRLEKLMLLKPFCLAVSSPCGFVQVPSSALLRIKNVTDIRLI